MKDVFFALLALLVAQNSQSQKIASKTFFGGKYGAQKVDSSNAAFVETVVRNSDGSLTKNSTSLQSGIVLSTESRRGDEPVGRWIYRDKRGAVRKALDYDFELKKGEDTCFGAPRYWLLQEQLDGKMDGVFMPPRLVDGERFLPFMQAHFEYPADARESGADGRIILNATFTKEVALANIALVKSAHPALGKEVARVLRMAHFVGPALLDGKPIELCVSIVVQLTLEDK